MEKFYFKEKKKLSSMQKRVRYLAKKINNEFIVSFIIVIRFIILELFLNFFDFGLSIIIVKFLYYEVLVSSILLFHASFAAKKYLQDKRNSFFRKNFMNLFFASFFLYLIAIAFLIILIALIYI